MTDVVIVAIVAAIPATLAACFGIFNRGKLGEVRSMVDGRLTQVVNDLSEAREQLRALTEKSSFAAGKKEEKGEADERSRTL